jgi:hypothetical protein
VTNRVASGETIKLLDGLWLLRSAQQLSRQSSLLQLAIFTLMEVLPIGFAEVIMSQATR